MTKRILIMGLPGAGKTTFAEQLRDTLDMHGFKGVWINADRLRAEFNDWDFSIEGRIRQASRMREQADKLDCDYAICDFVAPYPKMRAIFDADITVWMDTIKVSRYEDTNRAFIEPELCDHRVTRWDHNQTVLSSILKQFKS